MGGSNVNYSSSGLFAESSPVLEESSLVGDSSVGDELSDTESASTEQVGASPDRLAIAESVVELGMNAPTNLALATARPRRGEQLLVQRQAGSEIDGEIWPCVVIRLAGPEALESVEDGLDSALDDLAERLDRDNANRAVVVCLADGDAGPQIRGFAGPLDDLDECGIDVV